MSAFASDTSLLTLSDVDDTLLPDDVDGFDAETFDELWFELELEPFTLRTWPTRIKSVFRPFNFSIR